MDDRLDLPLLGSLTSLDWRGIAAAVDLACGTGRIGSWVKARGVERVDGVDASSAMLDRAAAKGIYDRLVCADAAATGLAGQRYDLAISSFVACHLADLGKLYAEARHLTRPSGKVVLVDYHPFMLLKGVPTHFTAPTGGRPQSPTSFISSATISRRGAVPACRFGNWASNWSTRSGSGRTNASLASRVWRAIWAIPSALRWSGPAPEATLFRSIRPCGPRRAAQIGPNGSAGSGMRGCRRPRLSCALRALSGISTTPPPSRGPSPARCAAGSHSNH